MVHLLQAHLVGKTGLAAIHERIRGELGGRVGRGPEEEEHRVQKVVPVALLLRHHLHHGLLQQRRRAVVQRVELRLIQRRHPLHQAPLLKQQL